MFAHLTGQWYNLFMEMISMLFSNNDILKEIKKVEEKKKMLEEKKEEAKRIVLKIDTELEKNPQSFYEKQVDMDLYGGACYVISKCQKDIDKCDAILIKLQNKLKCRTKR